MQTLREELIAFFDKRLDSLGYELVDLDVPSSKGGVLRIYIDSPGGITINDCVKVTRSLDNDLDDLDIATSYDFEVSSPGVNRPLRKESDFVRFKGSYAVVKTFTPEGRKVFKGIIQSFDNQVLTLLNDSQTTVNIGFSSIEKATLKEKLSFPSK